MNTPKRTRVSLIDYKKFKRTYNKFLRDTYIELRLIFFFVDIGYDFYFQITTREICI